MPNPLVSICVITYHSEKFVLETLESAKTQTYQNIELIISDDGSADSTIQICKDWLAENKDRFVRTELITVEKNTGIPANCNRAVRASEGEWIKLIAGDDILMENCVEDNVGYVSEHEEVKVLHSIVRIFKDSLNNNDYQLIDFSKSIFYHCKISALQQYDLLLTSSKYIIAPSIFIKRNVIIENNGYDERYKLMEDYPFWLKITKSNVKIHFFKVETVFYRKHSQSVFSGNNKAKLFNDFYKSYRIFEKENLLNNLNYKERFAKDYLYYRKVIFDNLKLNNLSFFSRGLFSMSEKINPNNYLIKKKENRIKSVLNE
jgi:alpha-1,3-rhamnosyltransferase